MRSCVVLVAVVACSSKSAVIDAQRGDAPAVRRDAPASSCRFLPPDAGMYDGPGCGCAIGDFACPHCSGVNGPCGSCGGGVGCGEGQFVTARCDGPEDCSTGMLCCDTVGGPHCVAPADCPAMAPVMCHSDGDCANGAVCCSGDAFGHSCKPSC